MRKLFRQLRPCRWPILFLGLYILLDLIGILYSPAKSIALTKYAVVIPMAVFAVLLVYYCDSRAKIDRILLNIGCVGTFLALFTLFNYFVVEILPIPYYRRLSMLTDYNRFASVIFTGFLMLLILLLNSKLPLLKKYAAIFGVSLIDYTVLNLCGSRRTYATLIPAIFIIVCYQLIRTAVRERSTKKILQNAVAMGLVSVIVFSFNASILKGFEDLSGDKYDAYVAQNGDAMEENSIDTIIDSMGGEGIFSKRYAIWSLALDEAASYSPVEMIVGKGTSYEAHLYDIRTNERLNELYAAYQPKPQYWMTPHNFLLSDFLSGGILKLAASLAVWVSIGWILLRMLRHKTSRSLIYGAALGILLINALISGRYTYIYDKYFWIFFTLMALEWNLVTREKGLLPGPSRGPDAPAA
ncbi:O-antigen ligase family protein [Zongyangia hominis]|uniref:O-antigen ligase family protein n=1 Tax=Zongyangia hominis TaxID=2763677 RepID=A0A926E9X5_9FIRM|nr:O-antigen ligase family protein [Zongyangia hominis]MBC8570620.1 O-antigen ligase family protein [Zongyangia hominis]